MDPSANGFYEFGPFRLDPKERLLLRDGQALTLTPKAFDTLLLLVENSGHLLTKEEMLRRLWPDTFVEEANLTNNISILRKALGETQDGHPYIRTIARVGYRFVASVRLTSGNAAKLIVDEPGTSTLVGREDVIAGVYEKTRAKEGVSGIRRFALQTLAACVVLAGLAVGSYFWINQREQQSATGVKIRSIAVLPFKPLVAGSRNEALELGMADTLITKLSNLTEITVRPTSAVRKYTNLEQDPVAAGREQQVDAVLDGSIQWSGEKIRVSTRLIRVNDGSQLWTHQCDEQCADVFAMQDSIAEEIAGTLALKLTGEERKLLTKHYTENREAFQLYLMGRFFWNKGTRDAGEKSIAARKEVHRDRYWRLEEPSIIDKHLAFALAGEIPG
jgi:DNA-binding winged helix-turn-helix (wHTH) protein/TolB-like protein